MWIWYATVFQGMTESPFETMFLVLKRTCWNDWQWNLLAADSDDVKAFDMRWSFWFLSPRYRNRATTSCLPNATGFYHAAAEASVLDDDLSYGARFSHWHPRYFDLLRHSESLQLFLVNHFLLLADIRHFNPVSGYCLFTSTFISSMQNFKMVVELQ